MDIFGFKIPKNIFVSIIIVLVSIVLYIITSIIISKINKKEKKKGNKRRTTLLILVRKIIKYIIIVLCSVFVLNTFKINTTALVTSIGAVSLVIGLALVLVHLIGINLTGTSVNPARSLSAAVFQAGQALAQVWVFIVAPTIGAIIAGLIYKYLK